MVGGKQEKPKTAPTAPSPGTLPTGKNQVSQKTQVAQATHPQGMGEVSVNKNTGAASLAPPPMSITGPKSMKATSEVANEQAAGSAQQLASQYAPSGWSMMGGQQMAQGLGSMFGQKQAFEKDAVWPSKETLVSGAKWLGGLVRPGASSTKPLMRTGTRGAPTPGMGPKIVSPRPATHGKDNSGLNITEAATLPRAATAAGRTRANMSGSGMQMTFGGLQGNMTANAMGGGEGSFTLGSPGIDPATGQPEGGWRSWRINPLGIAGGALMGNRGFRNSATGQTLWRPLAQSFAGTNIGFGMDQLGDMTGNGDPNDPEKWSRRLSRAGLMTGLGGNVAAARNSSLVRTNAAARAAGTTPVEPSMLSRGVTTALEAPSNAMTRMGQGVMDPFSRAGHFLWGKGAYQSGAAGLSGARKLGFRAGQGLTLGTGAAALGGTAYGSLHDQVAGDVDNKINDLKKTFIEQDYPTLQANIARDADKYMHERGFLNEEGQFDPTQEIRYQIGQRVGNVGNPFLKALGYDTENMTGGQRGMALGGMGLGGLGMLTGNPLIMAGGAGLAAYPRIQQNPGAISDAWNKLTGGQAPARDELHHQTNKARQAAQGLTGEGHS